MSDYLGRDIPKLGFGLMRLPMLGEDVDIEQTKQMVDLFLEHGYTYFDSAWGYLDGKSEEAAREALTNRYPREKFQFATKMPAWLAPNADEAKAMLDTSLRRTGLAYFDFYLMHNMGIGRTEAFEKYGIWDYLAEKKKGGVIRNLGFSIHAGHQHLEEILTKHPEVDFVQLQINYADWEDSFVQSRQNYETARKHGKPVVIMEPVKGGTLANPPKQMAELLHQANPEASFASWALRFAAGLDGLITVLSGMSNLEQMRDNLKTMDSFRPLEGDERAVMEKVQKMFADLPAIPCTDCRYCTGGCPKKIPIPSVFRAMNTHLVYGDLKAAKNSYSAATANGGKASDCIACGKCERACPQGIGIIEELERAAALLEA